MVFYGRGFVGYYPFFFNALSANAKKLVENEEWCNMGYEQVIGFILGFAFGLLVAGISYIVLKKAVNKANCSSGDHAVDGTKVMIRAYLLKVFLDFGSLFLVFFLRNHLPYPFISVLFGTAIALLVPGRALTVKLLTSQNDQIQQKKNDRI